jgi:AAA family ATPase
MKKSAKTSTKSEDSVIISKDCVEALSISLISVNELDKLKKLNQLLVLAYIKDQLIGKTLAIGDTATISIYGKPNGFKVLSVQLANQNGVNTSNAKPIVEIVDSKTSLDANNNWPNKNLGLITKKTQVQIVETELNPDSPEQIIQSKNKDFQVLKNNEKIMIAGLDKELETLTDIIRTIKNSNAVTSPLLSLFPIKGVLLMGPSGVGKTSLIKHLATVVPDVKFLFVNTRDLLSKFVGESEKRISAIFKDAKAIKPAVVFFDDIHILCNKKDVGGENSSVILNSFLNEVDCITTEDKVLVIIATSQMGSIDNSLRRAGRFDKDVKIEIPSPVNRLQILKVFMEKVPHDLTENDIVDINSNINGFSGADIMTLVRESVLKCTNLKNSAEIQVNKITKEAIESALVDINPSGLKDLLLEIPKVYWSDIGGYEDVKHKILQVIEWPLKHPEAYLKIRVNPAKGILLYGPPGCSKTMIAKAIATESKLNFIAIKGPELFSKYVGDSEKAIRELFKRARLCAPCIIFFDEIDAIATQRSHNTDVSDRVLTQLLTEMDGVETLKQVIVVAATNRPDSIDIALMRPGRFDEHIHVSLPDFKCRYEILRINIVGNKMPASKEIDIKELANKTEGYTGAEICMICREAGLNALGKRLDQSKLNSNEEIIIEPDCIKQEDFDVALEKITPRITQDTLDYYKNFKKNQKLL